MNRAIAFSAITLFPLCPGPSCDAPTPPARPAQTIYIGEDYNHPFNAEPGDTIHLVMNPDDGMLDRCNHAGGTLIQHAYTALYICMTVDF